MRSVHGLRWSFWGLIVAVTVLALIPNETAQLSFNVWDKFNHSLAFFVLAGLALAAYASRRPALCALALFGYGVLLELAQGLTDYREASALDAVANGVGIALALAVIALGRRARQGRGAGDRGAEHG